MDISRFVTDPDIIDADGNIVVLIIDGNTSDIENVGLFCKVCNKNYDIYLCNGQSSSLDWTVAVADKADIILKSVTSFIEVQHPVIDFVPGNALSFFQSYDEK